MWEMWVIWVLILFGARSNLLGLDSCHVLCSSSMVNRLGQKDLANIRSGRLQGFKTIGAVNSGIHHSPLIMA